MLGIGGVGMGNLALLLKEAGHDVFGSDAKVYPPMSDLLAQNRIAYCTGYDAANLPAQTDMAVIGNVVRSDNPEVLEIRKRGIPMLSMPQAIRQYLLTGRESIVVAGTHGKTTTSSLMAHTLRAAGLSPGFLIGGVPNDLGSGSAYGKVSGKHDYFVLEGDEYDSAFFQKEPKFLSYEPKHLVITSVEFDHADIYKNLDEITVQFDKVASIVPKDGHLLVCSDYPHALNAAKHAQCPVFRYGQHEDDDFRITSMNQHGTTTNFELFLKDFNRRENFSVQLAGAYNVMNAASVAGMLTLLGIDQASIRKGLATFSGVKRRQQVLFSSPQVTVVEDFAHHPTAITVTLQALRQAYPGREMMAVFEPRSNTTRRNFFQESLPRSLAVADEVLFYKIFNEQAIPDDQRLNRAKLQQTIQELGKACELVDSIDAIIERVVRKTAHPKLVVIMTNGDFDGLKPKLLPLLKD